MDNDRLLFTVTEAAAKLGLGRSLVYNLIMSGQIDSISIGRARRIPASALSEFIERRMAKGRANDE